jgi:hypothetical protein
MEVQSEWVKGHAVDLNRDPTKLERMNIVADELCDFILRQRENHMELELTASCGPVKGTPYSYEE